MGFSEIALPPGKSPARAPARGFRRPGAAPQQFWPGPAGREGMLGLWLVLRRRLRLITACLLVGISAGIAYYWKQPKVYRSATTLEIHDLNPNLLNARDLDPHAPAANSSDAYLFTQAEVLKSNWVLTQSLRRLLADPGAQPEGFSWRIWGFEEDPTEENIPLWAARARGHVGVRVLPGTRMVEVACEAENPAFTAGFLNVLTQEFIRRGIETRSAAGRSNNLRLGSELEGLRNKLRQSEERLREYAKKTGLLITEEKENLAEQKLRQNQTELARAQADRIAKQAVYELTIISSKESLPQVLQDTTLREYQAKITELQRNHAELNLTLTPEHTSVKKVLAQLEELRAARDKHVSRLVEGIRNDYEAAVRREKLLQSDYERQSQVVLDEGPKAVNYAMLRREVDTNRAIYDTILQKVKEYGIASSMYTSNAQVVDEAAPPLRPVRPSLVLSLLVGTLAGAFIGVVVAVVSERADTTLQEPGDLTHQIGVPELGTIPVIDRPRGSLARRASNLLPGRDADGEEEPAPDVEGIPAVPPELVVWTDRSSQVADSFRFVMASLLLSGDENQLPQVLMVTSANPREGKTTTCCNLGAAIAELKLRVLLIDSDLRAPRLQDVFRLNEAEGLAELLAGKRESPLNLVAMTNVPNLFVLPAGVDRVGSVSSFSPAHVQQMLKILQQLRREYHVILFDTPPILYLQDTRVIGRLCDGVILVARAGHTSSEQLQACYARMTEDGLPLLGTILNGWNPARSTYGYAKSYKHYSRYYRRHS